MKINVPFVFMIIATIANVMIKEFYDVPDVFYNAIQNFLLLWFMFKSFKR